MNIKLLYFIPTGIDNLFQAFVRIYDSNQNLIYEGNTYNGRVILNLENNSVYRVIAFFYNNVINKVFYVSENKNNYVFIFDNLLLRNERIITFLLTDANYMNLPIEKGEIILWQK